MAWAPGLKSVIRPTGSLSMMTVPMAPSTMRRSRSRSWSASVALRRCRPTAIANGMQTSAQASMKPCRGADTSSGERSRIA